MRKFIIKAMLVVMTFFTTVEVPTSIINNEPVVTVQAKKKKTKYVYYAKKSTKYHYNKKCRYFHLGRKYKVQKTTVKKAKSMGLKRCKGC